MSSRTVRAVVSVAVIVLAVGALFFVMMRGSADYYKEVQEVTPQPQAWYGKNLQLRGFVVENTIERRPNTLDYRFKIQNDGAVIQTSYTGVVPDTFKDGAEVVVKGKLAPDGFHAESMTAKCPSRYETAPNPSGTSASAGTGQTGQ